MENKHRAKIRIGMQIGVFYREQHLSSPIILIGRSTPEQEKQPDIDLSQDESVSRRHAQICFSGDGYYVSDLGSTNGTWVNGKRVAPGDSLRLCDGDRIALGRLSVLTVNTTDTENADSPTPT